MDFQQQMSYNKDPNRSLGPIFSELLEIYNSDIPLFESFEGNFSSTIEANYHQALDICCDHHHGVTSKMVELEKVKEWCSESDSLTEDSRRRSRARMKWTRELHERFVECVNRLGGAEKAKPKAILKLMSSNMLTIIHVKSHLQKYRTSKNIEEYSNQKAESITSLDETFKDSNSGINIKEALQRVNKCLNEQLEVQHNLERVIEEQGKQLKMMLEQQEKTNKTLLMKSFQISDSPTPQSSPGNSFDDDHCSISEGSGSSRSLSNV